MAEDIATASVSINMNGIGGDIAGKSGTGVSDSLKTIIELLKDIKETNTAQTTLKDKESKMGLSGLSGAGGILGTIGAIVGTIMSVGPLAGAAANTAVQYGMGMVGPGEYGAEIGYDEEGARNVYIINQKTGEIVKIWTEKEAIERGILTASGQMNVNYASQVKLQDITTDTMEEVGKHVILTNAALIGIADESLKQNLLAIANRKEQQKEKELRVEINRRLAARAKSRYSEVSTGLGYTDNVRQQSIMYNQFQMAALQDLANNSSNATNQGSAAFLQLITPNLNS